MSAGQVPYRAPDATYSARAMWLRMFAEGGRWRRAEVVHAFGEDAMIDLDLWELEQGRHVRRWGKGSAASYGVTRDCLVPSWITVGEMEAPQQAVTVLRAQASAPTLSEVEAAAAFAARGVPA